MEIKKELQELGQKEKSIIKKEQDRAKKMLFGEWLEVIIKN